VIFDRDGVLTGFDVATAAATLQSLVSLPFGTVLQRWQTHGAEVGFPRSVAEEAAFWETFWHKLATEFNLSTAVHDRLLNLNYTRFVVPFPDVRPALEAVRRRGLRIGVLSNFSLASLDASLDAAGLGDLVDVACAATVIGAAKPDPAAYAAVLQALDVSPAAALFLDDEPPCVAGARAVGMRAVLVDRRPAGDRAAGALPDLAELERLLVP
jgi:putative hydrolase of the HAD superfamily